MRILIVRTDALGDAIVTAPFIEVLANSVMHIKIDILCCPDNFSAFKFNPYLNKKYVINHIQGTKKLADNLLEIIGQINQEKYDLILVLNGCYRTYRYVKLINAKKIIARRLISKSFKAKLFIAKQKLWSKFIFFDENVAQHEVIRLDVFCNFVLDYLKITRVYELPLQAVFYLEEYFDVSCKLENSIIINASGKMAESRYINDALLFSLIKKLKNNYDYIGVIATSDDLLRVSMVIEDTSLGHKVKLICDGDIFNIAKEVQRYELFVGVDGGFCHLAAGLGLRCVVLFDKQNSQIWHPWSESQISLQADSCSIYDISYLSVVSCLKQPWQND